MSRSVATIMLAALALSVGPSRGAGRPSATVELRESVCVEGDSLTLAQLAEISPAGALESLGALELGPAPLPGDSRRLTLGYLKMRLRRAGVECEEMAFTGAAAVEVRRAPAAVATRRQARGEVEAADPPGARHPDPPSATIDRGSRVRLTVICGAVSIGAEATLLEDAVVGGRAKMRVEQTRETVVAQIVQPSEAIMRRE